MGGSAAQDVLDQLIELLAAAGPPRPVVRPVAPADGDAAAPVMVRVLSLDRVGRSQRRGPLLDLSMLVEVTTSGPHSLEYAEQLFVAVERSPWPVSTRPIPAAPDSDAAGHLGFWIQLTFSVPVPQPAPVLVQQPPEEQISVSSEGSTGW
jgi:hypothetical protein